MSIGFEQIGHIRHVIPVKKTVIHITKTPSVKFLGHDKKNYQTLNSINNSSIISNKSKLKEGSLVSNSLVVRDSSGWVTHRIERASNGVDLVVRNASTGFVEMRIANSIL